MNNTFQEIHDWFYENDDPQQYGGWREGNKYIIQNKRNKWAEAFVYRDGGWELEFIDIEPNFKRVI